MRFVRIGHIPSVYQLVILVCRVKRPLHAYLKDEGCHGRGWNLQQIDEEDFPGFSLKGQSLSLKERETSLKVNS